MPTKDKIKIPVEEIIIRSKPWVDKYMAGIFTGERNASFKEDNAKKLIKWHYDIMQLPMPKIMVAENLMEMYMMGKKLTKVNAFTDLVETKTKPHLQKKIEDQLFTAVDILENQQFYLSMQKPMHDLLSVALFEVLKTTLSDLSKDFQKSIGTANWNANILLAWNMCHKDEFGLPKDGAGVMDEFSEIYLNSGVYATIFSKETVVVCKYPKSVHFEQAARPRLHNPFGPAVAWGNTKGYAPFDCYFLHGRRMPKHIFELAEQGLLTREMFLNEKDEEVRAGMYEIIDARGEGRMMEFLGAELVDHQSVVHKNGDMEELWLYKTKEKFKGETDLNGKSDVPLAWLKMICPSTGQVYFLPSDSSFNNVLEAAKFHRDSDIPNDMNYSYDFRG